MRVDRVLVLVVAMGCAGRALDDAPPPPSPRVVAPPVGAGTRVDPNSCPDGSWQALSLGAGAMTPLRDGTLATNDREHLLVLDGMAVREIGTSTASNPANRPGEKLLELGDGSLLMVGGAWSGMAMHGKEMTWRFDRATALWVVSADLPEGRMQIGAVTMSDGGALVVGGRSLWFGSSPMQPVLPNAVRYDARHDVWTTTPPLTVVRDRPLVFPLDDGRVLVAGGRDAHEPERRYDECPALSSTEVYDPSLDRFIETRPMAHAREGLAAARLRDGRIFVASRDDPTTEIFDPIADDWSPGPDLPRSGWVATAMLSCGEVLVVIDHPSTGASAHRGDVETGRWAKVALPSPLGDGFGGQPLAIALSHDDAIVQLRDARFRYAPR